MGMESDASFDSSDSDYDSDNDDDDEEAAAKPRESVAKLLEEENIDGKPTALEEVVEASKNIARPELRQEEEDEIKKKLLEENKGGDLNDDMATVSKVWGINESCVLIYALHLAFLCACGPIRECTRGTIQLACMWRRATHHGSHSQQHCRHHLW